MKVINILGSTGSIGTNTLELIESSPNSYRLNILSANSNAYTLLDQIIKFEPKYAYLHDKNAMRILKNELPQNAKTHIIESESEYNTLLQEEHNTTICAIMGMAALTPTMHAIKGAKTLGLANKEVVICAFPYIKQELEKYKTKLIPLDSEHNAIYQMIGYNIQNVDNVIITASGGPFYDLAKKEFYNATPSNAIRHPNWKMGAKISVDTATLMNKGLEYIEACELFSLSSEKVKILVHRPSKVHAIVNFIDGSSVLQVNEPDMKVHISKALQISKNKYVNLHKKNFDFTKIALEFEELDNEKFELPSIAKQVYESGDLSMRIRLNNVNEVLVKMYLENKIAFGQIIDIIKDSISNHRKVRIQNLDDVLNFSKKVYEEELL